MKEYPGSHLMDQSQNNVRTVSGQYITVEHLVYSVVIIISIVAAAAMLFVNPLVVIGVIGALVAMTLLFAYPYIGVLGYIVFEYASVAAMFPFLQVLQLGKVIVLATLAVWGLKAAVRNNLRFVSDRINWWFAGWILATVISTSVAVEQRLALQGTFDIIKWFAIYFTVINLVDTLPKWQGCMWLFLVLAFRMSQFQIRQYSIGLDLSRSTEYFIREGLGAGSNAFFGNAGDFGVFMCVTAPLAYVLIKASRSKFLKIIAALFLIFFVVSIIKSGARGNTIGLLAVSLVFWGQSKRKLLIGLSIVSLVAVYWISAPDIVRSRFMSATSENLDGTSAHRLTLWKSGIKMALSHPLTGVGVNNFNRSYLDDYATPEEMGRATAPHNIFIQCLAELGFLGIASLLAIIWLMFVRNHQTRAMLREHQRKNDWITSFAYGLDLALVGYLVSGSFLSVLYYPHLFLLMALTVSLHNIARKRVEAGLDMFEGVAVSLAPSAYK
jgi:putative inorganic carbon (HCO3(-)) transporter